MPPLPLPRVAPARRHRQRRHDPSAADGDPLSVAGYFRRQIPRRVPALAQVGRTNPSASWLVEVARRDLAGALDRELSKLITERKAAKTRLDGTPREKVREWAETQNLDNILWTALVALLAITT